MEVYPPREDSLLLAKWVRKIVKPGNLVLDMGTGSGILGIEAKKVGGKVLAVDKNEKAVEEAREKGLNAIHSDLFSNVSGKFDIIIFNPPYLELSKKEIKGDPIELALHGGKMGREVLDKFLEQVPDHLVNGGKILFIQAEKNSVEKTTNKLEKLGMKWRVLDKKYIPLEGNLLVFLGVLNGDRREDKRDRGGD